MLLQPRVSRALEPHARRCSAAGEGSCSAKLELVLLSCASGLLAHLHAVLSGMRSVSWRPCSEQVLLSVQGTHASWCPLISNLTQGTRGLTASWPRWRATPLTWTPCSSWTGGMITLRWVALGYSLSTLLPPETVAPEIGSMIRFGIAGSPLWQAVACCGSLCYLGTANTP